MALFLAICQFSLFALFDFLKRFTTLLQLPRNSLCVIHFRLMVVSCRNWRASASLLLSPLGSLGKLKVAAASRRCHFNRMRRDVRIFIKRP